MKVLLKGVGANPGKVKGRVRVILDPKEAGKLKKGEILVVETTNPLFSVAIFHASAIVADYGGLLSHAAILSREIDIPCVVGTGEATKVLKDGMEVVVDGKEGSVLG